MGILAEFSFFGQAVTRAEACASFTRICPELDDLVLKQSFSLRPISAI